jgi:signal peptidase I
MENADGQGDPGTDGQPVEVPLTPGEFPAESEPAEPPKRKRAARAKAESTDGDAEPKPVRRRTAKAKSLEGGTPADGEVAPKPVRKRAPKAEASAETTEGEPAKPRRRTVKPVAQTGEQLALLAEVAGTPTRWDQVPEELVPAAVVESVPEEDLAAAEVVEPVLQDEVTGDAEVQEAEPVAFEVEAEPVSGETLFARDEEPMVVPGNVWKADEESRGVVVLDARNEEEDEGQRTDDWRRDDERSAGVTGGWVVTPVSTSSSAAGWKGERRDVDGEARDSQVIEGERVGGFAQEPLEGEGEPGEDYRDDARPPWAEERETEQGHGHGHARMKTLIREVVETGLLALLVFLSVKASFQNFKVDGLSMSPTLQNGQFLIVNKLVYSEVDMAKVGNFVPFVSGGEDPTRYVFHGPQRGDIIVLMDPRNPDQDLIKRVVGLPGETIEIVDGTVYINGYRLDEPYITMEWHDTKARISIPAGEYYVMGDNRNNSLDSRFDSVGLIPKELIIGKALLSYWPREKFGLAPNSPGTSGGPTVTEERINETGRAQQGSGAGGR